VQQGLANRQPFFQLLERIKRFFKLNLNVVVEAEETWENAEKPLLAKLFADFSLGKSRGSIGKNQLIPCLWKTSTSPSAKQIFPSTAG
jgi:hypothetical protein